MNTNLDNLPPVPFNARVVCGFEPKRGRHLRLAPGMVIKVTQVNKTAWWKGECEGKRGLFPCANVVPETDGRVPTSPRDGAASLQSRSVKVSLELFHEKLQDVMEREALQFPECVGNDIPSTIDHILVFIDKYGPEAEHVFRSSGSAEQIESLRALITADPHLVPGLFPLAHKPDRDIVILAGAIIKSILRELPSPLWPSELLAPLYSTLQLTGASRINEIVRLFSDPLIPPVDHAFILRLIALFHKLANSPAVKTNTTAFATIMGPSMFAPESTDVAAIQSATSVAEWIIGEWAQLYLLFDADINGVLNHRPTKIRAKATAGFAARGDGQLSFNSGDRLIVIDKAASGWLKGFIETVPEVVGWFPGVFAELSGQQSSLKHSVN